MMVRSKKNKIRSNEKQLKFKIKNLKSQLGRVRSTKQAKKRKNKIIRKQWYTCFHYYHSSSSYYSTFSPFSSFYLSFFYSSFAFLAYFRVLSLYATTFLLKGLSGCFSNYIHNRIYLFTHHLLTLGSLEFGQFHLERYFPLGTIGLKCSFKPLLRMFLLFIVKCIQSFIYCSANFISLKCMVGIILIKNLLVKIFIFITFLFSFLNIFCNFSLS